MFDILERSSVNSLEGLSDSLSDDLGDVVFLAAEDVGKTNFCF